MFIEENEGAARRHSLINLSMSHSNVVEVTVKIPHI